MNRGGLALLVLVVAIAASVEVTACSESSSGGGAGSGGSAGAVGGAGGGSDHGGSPAIGGGAGVGGDLAASATGGLRESGGAPAEPNAGAGGCSDTTCGVCGNTCNGSHNTGACVEGVCACDQGYLDCDAASGCETVPSDDPHNCGACGVVCASGACAHGNCAVRVFATNALFTGALGGLSGADEKCQAAADGAKLGGTFKAWLADGAKAAGERFPHLDTLYQRVDGVFLADSWSALQKTTLMAPIFDEQGQKLAKFTWTGMSDQGVPGAKGHCKVWTSAEVLDNGLCGSVSGSPGEDWQSYTVGSCADTMHLLCFEVAAPK